jgi:hypothetical protein
VSRITRDGSPFGRHETVRTAHCGLLARLSTGKSQGYPTSYPQALKRRLDDDSREKGTALESPGCQYTVRLVDPQPGYPPARAVPSDDRRPLACPPCSPGVVTRDWVVTQHSRDRRVC